MESELIMNNRLNKQITSNFEISSCIIILFNLFLACQTKRALFVVCENDQLKTLAENY